MSEKFDLSADEAKAAINKHVSDAAQQLQKSYRNNGKNIVIVKNTAVINTAIELASQTVKYHGIPDKKISNCKRFAHVCFWLIKLHPVAFVRTKDLAVIINALISKYAVLKDRVIDISSDDDGSADLRLNQLVALYTFATLVCDNFYDKSEAEKRVSDFMESGAATEVIRSMQYHNYSARTMAMYLESLIQDKLL